MAKVQTILQVKFVDGKSEVLEYSGDDLAGITKLLDSQGKKIAGVSMKTLGSNGKILFNKSFNYVIPEETGKVIKD